jgi:hypothetical protein
VCWQEDSPCAANRQSIVTDHMEKHRMNEQRIDISEEVVVAYILYTNVYDRIDSGKDSGMNVQSILR